MTYKGLTHVRHGNWSRRSFVQGIGAGIAAGVVGGPFSRQAAAVDGQGVSEIKDLDIPGANQPSEGLLHARQTLYQLQAKGRTGGESTLTSALAHLGERRNFRPSPKVPGYVTRDGFTFDPEREERRIALAEDLIRRIDPGPFEDPIYLALLAYQTASIELAFGEEIDLDWSKFLLGTVHSPELNAESQTQFFYPTLSFPQGYTVVVLNSALIEYSYQAAKALMAALNPVWSTVPGSSVTFEFSEQHIRDELARNQEPIERLYRTLEAYFFAGYPRAFYNESVPAPQVIPLTQLVAMTERWVIAHEYGHGFASRMGFTKKAYESENVENVKRAEEYFADNNATILTVLSAARLDAVGPHISLAGPLFALACLEVKRRALSVVRCGKVLPGMGDAEHPPNKARANNVLAAFDLFFEEGPQNGPHTIDLSLVLRPPDWKPVDSEAKKELHATVFRWSNALFAIWDQVQPRLQKDFENKRPLHPMWGPPEAC